VVDYILDRDAKRLAIARWGSLRALNHVKESRMNLMQAAKAKAKADMATRKRKVEELLEEKDLVDMKLPRAVKTMVQKYVRSGGTRKAEYSFDDVSARLHRVQMVTALTEIFDQHLHIPALRVTLCCHSLT
jgi:hypothetical protein